MSRLLGLVGFAFVVSITPGPNNALLLASGIRFGFSRTAGHVAGTAVGMGALVLAMAAGIGVLLTAVPGGQPQRAVSLALALVLAASVALIWT
jgi:threonine/homoserine/homoserine lactone efflux protein